jgi:hypothetical protein
MTDDNSSDDGYDIALNNSVNVTIISEFGGMWRGTAATSF